MSADKDKELICYRVQHDYDARDSNGEGIISIAINDVLEVRRLDLPDDCSEEHPKGVFQWSITACIAFSLHICQTSYSSNHRHSFTVY